MLKKNGWLVLVALVVLAIAYYVISFKKKQTANLIKSNEFMSASRVESLNGFNYIRQGQSVEVKFTKESGWLVSSESFNASEYPADMSLVKKMIQTLNSNQIEKVDANHFDTVNYTLNLSFNDGTQQKIFVHKQTTFDHKIFMSSQGYDYLGGEFWQKLIDGAEFRQKEIFLLDHNLSEVQLKSSAQFFKFIYNQDSNEWVSQVKDKTNISDKIMVKFLNEIMQVKIFRFFKDSINEKNNMKYGLDKPLFELKFKYGSEIKSSWVIKISFEDDEKFYGSIEHLNVYFQLNSTSIDLIKRGFNYL